jgi:two-component system NarL family sensor kinase
LEHHEKIHFLELVITTSCVLMLISIAFILLYKFFTKRLKREQALLRETQINFNRELNEATVKAEEKERLSIAMDLHDEIGGLLLVSKLNILNAKALSNASHEQAEILEETIVLIEKTAEAIRQISNRVLPPSLVKMGLEVALTEFIQSVNLTKRLDIDFQAKIQANRFKLDAELNIFRIVKESINNILKHGNTTKLLLEMQQDEAHLHLCFYYLGIGLMNEDVKRLLMQKNVIGLKCIQSRIQQLKASIDYQVSSDKQNHIRIKIPLHENKH